MTPPEVQPWGSPVLAGLRFCSLGVWGEQREELACGALTAPRARPLRPLGVLEPHMRSL